ncbi:MAG: hypothetical protein M5U12_29125 [Verrucomicrobia bacterium]|nr:hypothetical protein [Verrucomicrobiota bacterium]
MAGLVGSSQIQTGTTQQVLQVGVLVVHLRRHLQVLECLGGVPFVPRPPAGLETRLPGGRSPVG